MAWQNIISGRRVRRIAAGVTSMTAVAATLLALFASSCLARKTTVAKNGEIAFTSDSQRVTNVFAVNPDGSGRTQLTFAGYVANTPAWSPDGTRLAFTQQLATSWLDSTPGSNVFLVNADGSRGEQLTTHRRAYLPAWSPDGTMIAYVADTEDRAGSDIWVIRADGSGDRQLTIGNGYSYTPSWLPDGRIGFLDNAAISIIRSDGTGPRRLTDAIYPGAPAWSPDGKKLAFATGDGVYVMKIDGSSTKRVSPTGAEPAWSPDSKKLAFTVGVGSAQNLEIFTVKATGAGLKRLTKNDVDDRYPTWSPDGTKIAFSHWKRQMDIYVMNASDGSHKTNLTRSPDSDDASPTWQAR